MSRSDDRTKLMPTPAGDSSTADERTRAMPVPSDRQAPPPASEDASGTSDPPDAPRDAEGSTRALPVGSPPDTPSSEDRTRLLGTSAPEDATAVIGSASTGSRSDDPTVALGAGALAAGATTGEAFDDDVTIVRPQAQRRPRLLVQSPAGEVEEHGLAAGEAIIGRASSCTLVLANPEVSRKHARIVTDPTGSVLHVEGARRNTTVNGELVEGTHPLKHGDVLELANTRLVFAETDDTPSFDGDQAAAAASAPRSFAIPAIAAVAVAALGLGAYLLGSRSQPPVAAPPAAPAAVPVAPPVDTAAQAAAAAEAAREAAAVAVREVAEREANAARTAAREERIAKLLYEGDIALLENRLTTPTDGSAVYAYSEVLKIDPENEQARTKIADIIEQYLEWAETAKARGNRARARLYADKAAYIRVEVPSAGDGPALDARISALGGGTP